MADIPIEMTDEQLVAALTQALKVVHDNPPMKALLTYMLKRFEELRILETEYAKLKDT